MAQLKDLIVTGATRLIGNVYAGTIQITTLNAPTAAGGTTYGPGTNGYVLKSNGSSVYWGSDNNSVTGVKGNAESSYRTGQVNLTPANIGALALTGGTMTGDLYVSKSSPNVRCIDPTNNNLTCTLSIGSGHQNHGVYSNGYAPSATTFTSSAKWIIYRGSDGEAHSNLKIYGAVWNDYAEYRETKKEIEPGRCVCETGKGDLILTNKRMQEGCEIVSDTFGFAIGESEKCKTPTAATGRVLAYLHEDRELAKPGRPVCSGPNGTVSLMTNKEAREYPWCIIGTISEIPDYEIWHAGSNGDQEIKVNGRIWIRIR